MISKNKATCAIGGAAYCLKESIKYTKESKKFGLEENSYKISEMAAKLLACKLIVRQTARYLDEKHENALLYSALGKSFVPVETFEVFKTNK